MTAHLIPFANLLGEICFQENHKYYGSAFLLFSANEELIPIMADTSRMAVTLILISPVDAYYRRELVILMK